MNSKILVPVVALSAALALGGCASTPPKPDGGAGRTTFDCTKNTCDVPVGNFFLGEIDIPDVIQVDAKTEADKVTVTWTLRSWWGVSFDPKDGIVVKGPFKCKALDNAGLQYQCEGTKLTPRTDYKYTVTFAGSLRPWPIDPYIRN